VRTFFGKAIASLEFGVFIRSTEKSVRRFGSHGLLFEVVEPFFSHAAAPLSIPS
jgi:hypothetical protein